MSSDAAWVDSMPKAYEQGMVPVLFEPYAQFLAQHLKRYGAQRVLELAAGTGVVTRALVASLPDAEIVATDLSDAMVAFGAEHVPAATWRQADALDLPFEDDTFDLAVCQFGVMFFPDKPKGFAEMKRVLRDGGRAISLIWTHVSETTVDDTLNEVAKELFPEDPPDFIERLPHGYHDRDVITADAKAGGLHVESIERVELSATVYPREIAAGFCWGSPMHFELKKRGEVAALAPQVEAGFVSRLGEGPVEGKLAAWMLVATKEAS